MPPFQFKQFSIQQNNTAMKVGTDGVLLGCWSATREGHILDIGTGTGLIAIILAQRTKTALIDAVEVEAEAYDQANSNIKSCSWSNRITTYNLTIQHFETTTKYDLIISNPPFFIDSTKAPGTERNTARHTDSLSFSDLVLSVVRLLSPEGIFSIILPINEASIFTNLAAAQNLLLNRKCLIKPNPNRAPKRVLMEFSFLESDIVSEELTIETETRHQYTKEYISLTKDFYLKF